MSIFKCSSQKEIASCGEHKRQRTQCAPIKSTELKSLSVYFYIQPGVYDNIFDRGYDVKLEPAGDDKFSLSCNNHAATVGTDVAKELQNLIKKHNLESLNGLYDVTAGLPAEFQPSYFRAKYASGEELRYTINNFPRDPFGIELFRYVRDVLIANGDSAFIVPDEFRQIDRMKLDYSEGDGILYIYDEMKMLDGTFKLSREVYDSTSNEGFSDKAVPIPAGYKEGLTDLVEKLGIVWTANRQYEDNKNVDGNYPYCHIYATNAKGGITFFGTYSRDEMNDEIRSIIRQIREYMDRPFKKK